MKKSELRQMIKEELLKEGKYEHLNAEFDEMKVKFMPKVDEFLKQFDKWCDSEDLVRAEKGLAADEMLSYIAKKYGLKH